MRDLREFHDPNLHLPINGKVYTVKAPNAELGLKIKAHFLKPERNPEDEIKFISQLFGSEWDKNADSMSGGLWAEMDSDGVPLEEIQHVGNTAMAHYGVNPEFGEFWWETRLGKEATPILPEAEEEWARMKQEAAKPKTRRRKKTTS